MIFKLDFTMHLIKLDHVLYYSHASVVSFHTFQARPSRNTNPSLFIQVVKVQQNERKKKPSSITVWVLNM